MAGRKQTALDLAKLVDKPVMVKLQGGREVTGVLKVQAPPRGRARTVPRRAPGWEDNAARAPEGRARAQRRRRRLGGGQRLRLAHRWAAALRPIWTSSAPRACTMQERG